MRWIVLLAIVCVAVPTWGLEPDELLLVVNANVPEGRRLAEFYAQQRGVPAGRIVELKLPKLDDLSFWDYERDVVPPVRAFLREQGLAEKVKCLVTFYGVPIRIAERAPTAEEQQEIAQLQAEEKRVLEELRKLVEQSEAEVKTFAPQFVPEKGEELDRLAARADGALKLVWQRALQTEDKQLQAQRVNALANTVQRLGGPAGVIQAFGPGSARTDEGKATLKGQSAQVAAAVQETQGLEERRFEAASRDRLRKLVAANFGLVHLARALRLQLDYLNPEKAGGALDSELSMLWWPLYRRSTWHVNPLNHQVQQRGNVAPTLMVMRLDAPQAGMVRELIAASLKAEREGLRGRVVLDGRGIDAAGEAGKVGGYGWYDQSVRDLARLLRTKTPLPLLYDDSPGLLPAGSAKNVALYCGWYSVRNYVPTSHFSAGAVGFHVASFELMSLRNPEERGWVPGLLRDGIAATLGSVGEPYLVSFPQADEFFPLLLTGKLTLAEVYWRTTPYTSWMMAMVGDPLYRPFASNPVLLPADLPRDLQRAFVEPGATQPASAPATRPAIAPASGPNK